MDFPRFLRSLTQPKIKSLNRMEVSKTKFLSNYAVLRNLQKEAAFFPVVKANAYGHGLEWAVKTLAETDCAGIAVDSYVEYQFVRKFSKKDVLVLSETFCENYEAFDRLRTVFCIHEPSTLKFLGTSGKTYRIHLFLNTGMNREGIREDRLDEFLSILSSATNVRLEGVCSHLSSADEAGTDAIEKQAQVFKRMYARIEAAGFSPTYRHIAASAGILKMHDPFFNACRPWIALYGFNPLEKEDLAFENGKDLHPIMEIVSTVTALQRVPPGEGVGYGQTFVAEKETLIATVPFGYSEGLDRRLSNKGKFLWKERILPIRGRVCMNLSMVEASGLKISPGDEVTVISASNEYPNSVEAIAKTIGTIPYEVLVRFPANMRRVWNGS